MIYANVYAEGHISNSLFASEDAVHRYNPTYTPRLLRQKFLEYGIEINTPDLNAGREIAFDLYMEGRPVVESDRPKYLIALENPYINTLNADRKFCEKFSLVFAWDKRLHDLPNVVPVMIPHPMKYDEFPGYDKRDIFSCLINANKAFKISLPSDLYMERIKVIRWYEKNAPEKFELYGLGWDKESPAFTTAGKIKRGALKLLRKIKGGKAYPSYRGEVRDKGSVLKRSKFSWCYENSRDLSNYITEKMLDSMVNGSVPVYWGADNVLEHIPSACFIDRRNFKDTAEVQKYLQSVSEREYTDFQQAIEGFINSDSGRQFSSDKFTETVVENINAAIGQAD